MNRKEICAECTNCGWYWQNNDTECECKGKEKPCVEFTERW